MDQVMTFWSWPNILEQNRVYWVTQNFVELISWAILNLLMWFKSLNSSNFNEIQACKISWFLEPIYYMKSILQVGSETGENIILRFGPIYMSSPFYLTHFQIRPSSMSLNMLRW